MPERTVTIASSVGLHARPAAIFVKAASEQPVKVTIVKVGSGADPVDASSILGLTRRSTRWPSCSPPTSTRSSPRLVTR